MLSSKYSKSSLVYPTEILAKEIRRASLAKPLSVGLLNFAADTDLKLANVSKKEYRR